MPAATSRPGPSGRPPAAEFGAEQRRLANFVDFIGEGRGRPIEWIKDRLDHLQEVPKRRAARSAQALRDLLGPDRLEPVTPDI